ncbi:MAG: Nif3-like dinuclear metal center hexameric protein [Planctomycetota bacterium]
MPSRPTVRDCVTLLERLAPPDLDEAWDNTGLLFGHPSAPVSSVTTCLTLTADVADEAIARGDGLIVSHHPVLFRPVQRLTADDPQAATLLKLAAASIAVFSPHCRWDNTAGGINDRLGTRFGLHRMRPLRVRPELAGKIPRGSGRIGVREQASPFDEFVREVKQAMNLESVAAVPTDRVVRTVGVACGSAGEYLQDAIRAGCDAFVTGETSFHTALEARTAGIGLLLIGHYVSERFSLEELAEELNDYFPDVPIRASDAERDPLIQL